MSTTFSKFTEAEITGERKNFETTIFPSTVKAGETVPIRLPQLRSDMCLVPNSVNVAFDFKVTGTKSVCVNNLSKALVKGGKDIYDNKDESTFSVFKDLWLTKDERLERRGSGIMTESMRKKISGDDSYISSLTTDGLYAIFGSTCTFKLGQVLENRGLFIPCALRDEFQFDITLASNEDVLVPQPTKKGEPVNDIGTYHLQNLRLEYEVIENKSIADDIIDLYGGYNAIAYEDVMLYKRETWNASDTIRNLHINPTRQSLKAVVCLWKQDTATTENYEYPNIERVKITSDGIPGAIYNHGISKGKPFFEAKRLFGRNGVTETSFFLGSQFAMIIDLRTTAEKDLFENGKEMSKKQESQISIEITKKPTENNLTCYVY